MKILMKAKMAGAVMLAVAGVAVGTAQADSLLAPLVINDTGSGYETYFAFKMKGQTMRAAGSNAPVNADEIHYTYIKKGTAIGDLAKIDKICKMENNSGQGSKGDVIFQSARGVSQHYNAAPANDASVPNGYTAGNFVGMMVIDDSVNLKKGTQAGQDGDSSGFAYIVNATLGVYQDYKLLNNHHKKTSGDFSIGFISKTAIDFMWLGSAAQNLNPLTPTPVTGWVLSVTGPDMTKHTGTYNSDYGLEVKLSQKARGANDSPEDAVMGVYDNDEVVISGDKTIKVTCMAALTRASILTPLQLTSTEFGGWTRKSVTAQTDAYAGTDTPKVASGAIVYRSDSTTLAPGASTTMQVETGGHLAAGHNHVNRAY